jgi:hypothetical protein
VAESGFAARVDDHWNNNNNDDDRSADLAKSAVVAAAASWYVFFWSNDGFCLLENCIQFGSSLFFNFVDLLIGSCVPQ